MESRYPLLGNVNQFTLNGSERETRPKLGALWLSLRVVLCNDLECAVECSAGIKRKLNCLRVFSRSPKRKETQNVYIAQLRDRDYALDLVVHLVTAIFLQ